MPGTASNFLAQKLCDHVFGGTTYSQPATLYIELYTANPTDAGGGNPVSGGGYTRLAVTNNSTNFGAADSTGNKANLLELQWPTATADWGVITGFGIFDASSGGNFLSGGSLNASVTVLNTQRMILPVGAITLSVT